VLQTLAQRGVVGFPDDGAGGDGAEVDVAGMEMKLKAARSLRSNGCHAAPLLILLGMALIEDDAVVGLQRGLAVTLQSRVQIDHDGFPRDELHGADAAAAGLGEAGRDQALVIDAGEEAVGEAAGEGLLEIAALLL
jgi:hypothetical protein